MLTNARRSDVRADGMFNRKRNRAKHDKCVWETMARHIPDERTLESVSAIRSLTSTISAMRNSRNAERCSVPHRQLE